MDDQLTIAGRTFRSRLMVGTGKYQTFQIMQAAIRASGAEIVTVALRRVNFDQPGPNLLDYLDPKEYFILPNTAGCATVQEAVRVAQMARALGFSNWIKLEVIPDPKYLLPDPIATIEATQILTQEGFVVLPFTIDSPSVCERLLAAGAPVVMPGGSPIGSGQGVLNCQRLKILREQIHAPLVVDSGIGAPSDAALAMESGADAVLLNTALAEAEQPVVMATAMKLAVQAGRCGYLAGRMPVKAYAAASSPVAGVVRG